MPPSAPNTQRQWQEDYSSLKALGGLPLHRSESKLLCITLLAFPRDVSALHVHGGMVLAGGLDRRGDEQGEGHRTRERPCAHGSAPKNRMLF